MTPKLRPYPECNDSCVQQEPTAIPLRNEQVAIVDYIEESLASTGKLITRAHDEMRLIREYRTRLIADVVTGKVDVRGLAPADTTLDDEQIDEGIDDEDLTDEDVVMAEEPADE